MRMMTTSAVAAALVGLALAAGCSSEPGAIGLPQAALSAGEGSPGFLDRISAQTEVSENDAMRGVLLLLDGQDPAGTFGARVAALRKRGIIPAGWDVQADKPLTRGRMAYMIYQACDVPGGVILRVAGPSQWYCLKELQYQGIVAERYSVFGRVTGMEFVAVLARGDAYVQTGRVPEALSATGGQ